MKAIIYCTRNANDGLDFRMAFGGKDYYLHTMERFSIRIYKEFSGGQYIDSIFRASRFYNLQNAKERLIRSVEYIEKENNITLLDKTARRGSRPRPCIELDEELCV